MTTLLLVRHGEAHITSDGDGALTARGAEQAKRFGAWCSRMGFALDGVWSGPLQRQRDTARHLATAAAEAGHRALELRTKNELAELSAFEILRAALPQMLSEEPAILAEYVRHYGPECTPSVRNAPMAVIHRALERWSEGQLDVEETFAAFEARVRTGLLDIVRESGPEARVAVVTSAGPIAVAMRLALAVTPAMTIALGRAVINSSLTELWFHEERFKLIAFNVVGHLRRDEITTMLGPAPENLFSPAGADHGRTV